jgi:hypothetical protein
MNQEPQDLEHRLSNTLDRSLQQLDDNTLQQLSDIRHSVQHAPKRHYRAGIAIAASVALMVLVPWLTLTQPDVPSRHKSVAEDYLSVDPQMLVDWEMLEAIGELPDV